MRLRICIVVSCLLLLLSFGAFAQNITGDIAGTVKDATGAVIPKATITISSADKNVVVRTVTSNNTGDYSVPLLPIGRYTLTAEAQGFKKATTTIQLNANDKRTVPFALEVGQATETVNVEASALQVEMQTAATAGLITGTQVRELALNNRNYIQLLTLMPGVSSTQPEQFYVGLSNPLSGGFNTLGISVNGQRTSANNWTVDGADNVDRGSNLGLLTTPSIDSIAEVKVLRSNYDAEYGRAGAGQVNVLTRSGTSQIHGSAYEFWRNENLNADSFFNKRNRFTSSQCARFIAAGHPTDCDTRTPLRYHNFGYTIGGPVAVGPLRKNTFFFFSEEFRKVINYSNAFAAVPTQAELGGTFTDPVCILNANLTCSGNYTKQITPINPVAAAYIKDIWSKIPLSPDLSHNVLSTFRTLSNYREESVKIDHVFSQKFSVYGRYLHDSIPTTEPRGLFGPSAASPGIADTASNAPGWSATGHVTYAITPALLVEGGYNYSFGAIFSSVTGLMNPANSPDIKVNTPFTPQAGRLPSIAFSGPPSNIGSFGPYDDENSNHQSFGNVTWVKGRHTWKLGGTYYHYRKFENGNGGNPGSFTIPARSSDIPVPTGVPTAQYNFEQSWANFLQGRVSTFSQPSQDITADLQANQFEFYGQDQFRLRPNLTINYGVRWSLFRQPTDARGLLTSFDPRYYDPNKAPKIDPVTGLRVAGTGDPLNGIVPSSSALANCQKQLQQGVVAFCWASGTTAPFGNKVSNETNNNFAPRLGIAWDPWGDGKTSFRTGFGLFYDVPLFGTPEQNILTNIPFVRTVNFNNSTLDNPTAGTANVSQAVLTVAGRVSEPFSQPYSENFNLDMQHEFARGWLLDTGYVGVLGRHLLGLIDLNQPQPGAYIAAGIATAQQGITASTAPKLNAIRPYKGYGNLPAIRNIFTSNYNALQTSLTKRLTGNSSLGVAYTWSHALTFNQTDRSTNPQNTYDLRAEYGPMQQDRRHIFTVNYVYELPWLKDQKGFVGHVLGGWEVSGITTAQSGVPLTVTGFKGPAVEYIGTGTSFAGAGLNAQRPDQIGNPNAGGAQTLTQWFNTAAFADVPAGAVRAGSERRGAVVGPGFQRWDVSVFKNLKFTERFTGQFRAEAFNVFNHTQWSGVNTSFASAQFGQITSTRDPRIMQLGLKLNF